MNGLSLKILWSLASVGLAAVLMAGTAGATMVVLDCPGGRQTAMVDATGQFKFSNVPDGACRLVVSATGSPVAASPAAVTTAREAGSGMATGKRQHQPVRFSLSLDGTPTTNQIMALDDWSAPASISVSSRKHELTGHVTLMK